MNMYTLEDDLNYTMSIFRAYFRMIGSYPDEEGYISKLGRIVVLAILTYCLCMLIYSAQYEYPNLEEMALNAIAIFAVFGAILKFVKFTTRSKQFIKMRNTVTKNFWSTTSSTIQEEKDLIIKHAKLSFRYSIHLGYLIFSCVVLTVLRILLRMFVFTDSGHYHQRTLIFRTWVPFDIIDVYAEPFYEIFFIVQSIGGAVTVIVTAGVDCSFVFLIFNTCGQFKILNMMIKNYQSDHHRGSLSVEEFLKSCIKHHQELNNFSAELEDLYNLVIFATFLNNVTFLCLTGYVFLTSPGGVYDFVETVIYFICEFLQLFIYCYAADQLTSEAQNIGDAAYTSNWMDSPSRIRKLIIMIIIRAQKPNHLTALKLFPVTISTFESISRTSMSYLTVLNRMKSG